MTEDLIYYASGFEILFGASALIGLWFSRRNFSEAWADYRSTGGITNGRRYVGVATIVIETILLSIHAFYIIATAVAVNQPYGGVTTPVGILVQSILVYASWGMTAISGITRKVRMYLDTHGLQARGPDGKYIRER